MSDNHNQSIDEERPRLSPRSAYDRRLYYRGDRRLIKSALDGRGEPIFVTFGLRRYGKTWFLRRVEDVCKTGEGLDKKSKYDCQFVSMPDESSVAIDRISAFRKKMEKAVEAGDETKFVLIIDDLQKIDDRQSKDFDYAERLAEEIEEFVAFVSRFNEEKGRLCGRLILSEPTNFKDWLKGETQADSLGPAFRQIFENFATPGGGSLLRPLTDDEAHQLLSEASDGDPLIEELDSSLSRDLCFALGGNPWLLSFALSSIRNGSRAHDDFSHVYKHATDLPGNDGQKEGLDSLYSSLSGTERLMLRIVYDATRPGQKDPRTNAFLLDGTLQCWKAEGRSVGSALERLNLLSGRFGGGNIALPRFMLDYFLEALKHYSTFGAPSEEDLRYWSELLIGDAPFSKRMGEIIIHQLSDVFLDSENSPQWDAYVRKLKALHEDATGSGSGETKDLRPDLIVICGNLMAGPTGLADQKERKESEDEETRHWNSLEAVARRLEELRLCLRPIDNRPGASAKQIVLLPGVFDLLWSEEFVDEQIAGSWNKALNKFLLAGQAYDYESLGLKILPFDATHVDGARERGGRKAVQDLKSIRHRLVQKFTKNWRDLRRFTLAEPAGLRAAENLAKTTLGYVLEVADDEEALAYNEIEDPTFKWRGSRDEGEDPQLYLSDTGFVRSAEFKWLSGAAGKPAKKVSKDAPILIAVTHYHPENHRRSGVIEFFNEHKFREALVRMGVQALLHGRSAYQQLKRQRVDFSEPGASRGDRVRYTTIDLIGSGSFSAVGGMLMDGDNKLRTTEPSFNEIILHRNDRHEDGRAKLLVRFWDYDEKTKELQCTEAMGDTL